MSKSKNNNKFDLAQELTENDERKRKIESLIEQDLKLIDELKKKS